MKTAHMPELWTFDERHTRLQNYEPSQTQSEWYSIIGIGNEFALDVITPPHVSRKRNVEIARLIAAAPELLESLRRLIVIVRDSRADGGPAWIENAASDFVAAQAAIDKAIGGNP